MLIGINGGYLRAICRICFWIEAAILICSSLLPKVESKVHLSWFLFTVWMLSAAYFKLYDIVKDPIDIIAATTKSQLKPTCLRAFRYVHLNIDVHLAIKNA